MEDKSASPPEEEKKITIAEGENLDMENKDVVNALLADNDVEEDEEQAVIPDRAFEKDPNDIGMSVAENPDDQETTENACGIPKEITDSEFELNYRKAVSQESASPRQPVDEEIPTSRSAPSEISEYEPIFLAQVGKPYVVTPLKQKPKPDIVIKQYEDFLKKGKLPDEENREAVTQYINRKGLDAMRNGNYKEAKKMNQMQTNLINSYKSNVEKQYRKKRTEDLKIQIENAESQKKVLEENWKTKIENFVQQEEEKLKNMAYMHQGKLEKFDKKFENVDNLRQYSKPSIRALSLRERERALLITNNFPEAAEVRKEAEKIEAEEAAEKQIKAEKDVNTKRDILLNSLQRELEVAADRASATIRDMENRKEMELQQMDVRIAKLGRDLEQAKRMRAPLSSLASKQLPPIIASPRAQKDMVVFKSESYAKRLVVKPKPAKTPKYIRKRSIKDALPDFNI